MKIEIKSVKDVGSCNFCQRGKEDREAKSNYPYDKVYEIKGRTIGFRICEDCMIKFTEIMLGLPLIQDREEHSKYDKLLIKWVKDHYWDSLEKDKDLILRHLRTFAGDEFTNQKKKECDHEWESVSAVKCEKCGMIIED